MIEKTPIFIEGRPWSLIPPIGYFHKWIISTDFGPHDLSYLDGKFHLLETKVNDGYYQSQEIMFSNGFTRIYLIGVSETVKDIRIEKAMPSYETGQWLNETTKFIIKVRGNGLSIQVLTSLFGAIESDWYYYDLGFNNKITSYCDSRKNTWNENMGIKNIFPPIDKMILGEIKYTLSNNYNYLKLSGRIEGDIQNQLSNIEQFKEIENRVNDDISKIQKLSGDWI